LGNNFRGKSGDKKFERRNYKREIEKIVELIKEVPLFTAHVYY
jgi:hypothetical protein